MKVRSQKEVDELGRFLYDLVLSALPPDEHFSVTLIVASEASLRTAIRGSERAELLKDMVDEGDG